MGSVLSLFRAGCRARVLRINQRGKNIGARYDLMQQFQPLRHHRRTECSNASEITPRAVESRDKAEADWVFAHVEDNRYRCGYLLRRDGGSDTKRGDGGYLSAH